MYTEHFGLTEKPFNLVPNPSYLFLSTKHANALTFLEYGLTEQAGFVMLTGEVGIGKTTLVRHLLNQIESKMDVGVIFNTNVLSGDLILLILNEFEIPYPDDISKAKALEALYEYLIRQFSSGRKVLLIIDEAQNLSDEVLEEIRMLSNLQTDEEMLLQIMIVGQPQLRNKISHPRLEQFAQRIAVSFHLSAMTHSETGEYIAHRMEKAGGHPGIFTEDAVNKIFEASGGIPRTINLLCDAALVYGFADGKNVIDPETVDQVIEDKGGIGVFTRDSTVSATAKVSEKDEVFSEVQGLKEILGRVDRIERQFAQLKEVYHGYTKEMESRAEFCRDAMVAEWKRALASERHKNLKLTLSIGALRERYHSLKETDDPGR